MPEFVRRTYDDPERRLATLLAVLPGMAYRCRADGERTMEFVSEGCLEVTGLTVAELTTGAARAFVRMIAPFDRQAVDAGLRAALAGGGAYALEFQIVHASGRRCHVSDRGRCVGYDGGVALLEGYITDVTVLKATHFDLGERMKELRLLYEISALCSSDRPLEQVLWGCVEKLPPAYCYPVEVAARLVVEGRVYCSPQFHERPGAPRQRAAIVAHGQAIGEALVVRVSGEGPADEYFLIEEQAMLAAAADRIGGCVERLRIREALRDSERKARTLYEHLPIPTVVWQRREEGFVLVGHNVAARSATAGEVEAWVGQPASALLASYPELIEAAERCLVERTPLRREVGCTLADGRTPVLSLSLGFVPPDLVLVHATDVTAERRLQERLHQVQKMEVLGRMAAGVAHDFNNMLTVMLSYTDLLIGGTAAPDPALADLLEIRTAVERAAALTRQLTTFSHQDVVRNQVVDLNQRIRGVRRMLETLLGDERVLTLALTGAPCTVEVHPPHIDQVLLNLVANARDATACGGQVTVVTNVVDLDAEQAQAQGLAPGEHVLLTVSDDGVGMDAATAARVFEPFFTTKAAGNGSGMGLATVYGIVRQCSGHAAVVSEPGHGTTFSLFFPRAGEATTPEVRRRDAAPQRARAGETILVVEDDESIRRLVQRVLTEAGYRVLTAASGAEARVLYERHDEAIDLLLTDIVLPWQSGPELAGTMPPQVRVLFMSGYAERAARTAAELVPGMNFLAKPFTPEVLTRMVRTILDGRGEGR